MQKKQLAPHVILLCMNKSSFLKNSIPLYTLTFFVILFQAYATAAGNYVLPLLLYASFGCIYLFYVDKRVLFFLILFARIILDSMPSVTYPKLAFGLSFMEYFTFGLMIFMLIYLLMYHDIALDAISKSAAFILVAMATTTLYHGNLADFVDAGSRWMYFIVAYLFFKYLLNDISIKYILTIIAIISLYPLINQIYAIVSGTAHIYQGVDRYSGTFYHVFIIGEYLFFVIPAALYLYLTENRGRLKQFYFILLVLCHIGIFMAGYRTIWFATVIFWVVYIIFVSRRKFISISLLLFILIISPMSSSFVGHVFSTRLRPVKIILEDPSPLFKRGSSEYDRFLSGRIGIWRGMLEQYEDSNIIEKVIGRGIDITEKKYLTHMHNQYFSLLVETGLFGMSMMIIFICIVLKRIYASKFYNKLYSFIVLSTFISFLVIAFGTIPFTHIIVLNYMAIYFAVASNSTIKDTPVSFGKHSNRVLLG